ncbi:hypothetical protein B0H10DRAFT_1942223 [Mycena sp. CBHHK59/15]|nr:hypothetical protein B0H10DRAFT_1942223 [Mycena sp. CBHHK59/15]
MSTRGIGQSETWWAWSAGEGVGRMQVGLSGAGRSAGVGVDAHMVIDPSASAGAGTGVKSGDACMVMNASAAARTMVDAHVEMHASMAAAARISAKSCAGKGRNVSSAGYTGGGKRGTLVGECWDCGTGTSFGDLGTEAAVRCRALLDDAVGNNTADAPCFTILLLGNSLVGIGEWTSSQCTGRGRKGRGDSARDGGGDAVTAGEDGGEDSSEVSHTWSWCAAQCSLHLWIIPTHSKSQE